MSKPDQKSRFNVGAVVVPKSGGSPMTVHSIRMPSQYDQVDGNERKPTISCQWFGGKKLEHGSFPEDNIEFVKARDGSKE